MRINRQTGASRIKRILAAFVVATSVLAAFPMLARAQSSGAPDIAETQELLFGYITDELKIDKVEVLLDATRARVAVNVGKDDDAMIIGKMGMLISAAGAAAPWTQRVELSVYSAAAPLVYVKVPTAKITAYLNDRIETQAYLASWEFEGLAPSTKPGPKPAGGGAAAGGQAGQSGNAQAGAGQSGPGQSGGQGQGQVPGQGAGQVITLPASADTHVYAYAWQGWNAANWGKYEVLGAGWNPTGGEKRAFLRFDLSKVDLNKVRSAKLRLYHYHTAGNGAKPLGIYRVTEPWTEGRGTYKPATPAQPGETTWLHQPGFDPRAIISFSSVAVPGQWITVDVTDLVKAWASGLPNHGLMLRPLGRPDARSPEAMFGFYSRENREADKRPQLVLDMAPGGGGQQVLAGTQAGNVPGGGAITWNFETGDLSGWSRTGTAFDFQPTRGDNPTARRRGQPSNHQGDYWIGGYEKISGPSGRKARYDSGRPPRGNVDVRHVHDPARGPVVSRRRRRIAANTGRIARQRTGGPVGLRQQQ